MGAQRGPRNQRVASKVVVHASARRNADSFAPLALRCAILGVIAWRQEACRNCTQVLQCRACAQSLKNKAGTPVWHTDVCTVWFPRIWWVLGAYFPRTCWVLAPRSLVDFGASIDKMGCAQSWKNERALGL